MTLESAPIGHELSVLRTGTAATAVTRRLAELGLRPRARIRIVTRTSGGGAVIAIADDRLALSRAILSAIDVTDPAHTHA